MSFDEGTEHGERRTLPKNKSIGGCGKHIGQPLINCPLCSIERENKNIKTSKTLQELAIENNLSGDELMLVSCYLVSLRMHRKGINPEVFMKIVNNWERIEKAINVLKHDLL